METPRGPVLRKMFKAMDTDGDGSIDEREGLAIGRVLAGDTAGAVQFWEQLRKGADSDGDGVVSLDEYLQYSRAQTASRNPEEVSRGLEEHLQRLQESRARQFQQMSYRAPVDRKEKARAAFKHLDADGNGKLDMFELLKLARSDSEELDDLCAAIAILQPLCTRPSISSSPPPM